MALCVWLISYRGGWNSFFMYPEDALGPCVQSGTIMWEHVESLFHNIRELMRKSGRARTGTLSMPWTAACMRFLQVYLNHDMCT